MIKRIRNISILITVTLVIAIVIVILFWLNSYGVNGTKITKKSDSSHVSVSQEVSTTNQPTKTSELIAKKVRVPDWGIEFVVPATLLDTEVKYYHRQSSDVPSREYFVFTTTRIRALGGKCVNEPFGDTVILNRNASKDDMGPHDEVLNEQPINGYYYTLSSPIAPCSGFDESDNMRSPSQIEVDDRDSLQQALRSLYSI